MALMTLTEARDWALLDAAGTIRELLTGGCLDTGLDNDGIKDPADRKRVRREVGRIAYELRSRAGVRACSTCGCSEDDACEGSCSWIGPDLCSACAAPTPTPAKKKRRRRD